MLDAFGAAGYVVSFKGELLMSDFDYPDYVAFSVSDSRWINSDQFLEQGLQR